MIPEDSEQPNDGPGRHRKRIKWDASKFGRSLSRMVEIVNRVAEKIRVYDETITTIQIEEASIPYDLNVFVVHPDGQRTQVYNGDILRISEMIVEVIKVRKIMLAIAKTTKDYNASIMFLSYGGGSWRRYNVTITKIDGTEINPPVTCVNEKMNDKLTYGEVMRSLAHMKALYELAQLAEAVDESKASTIH